MSRPGPPDIKDTYSLLVLNITYRTTVEDLFPLFERYGKVEDVFIPRDRRTGTSRGFAFIRYKRYEEAEKAVHRLDGRTIDGREIMVKFAKYGRNEEKIEHGRIRSSSPKRRFRSRSHTPPRGGDRSEYRGGREVEHQRQRGSEREYRRESSRERRYRDDRGRDGYRDDIRSSGRLDDEGRGRRGRDRREAERYDRRGDSPRRQSAAKGSHGSSGEDRSRDRETNLKRDLDRSPVRDEEEDAAALAAGSPVATAADLAAASPGGTATSPAGTAAVPALPNASPAVADASAAAAAAGDDIKSQSEQLDEPERSKSDAEVPASDIIAENGIAEPANDSSVPETNPLVNDVDVQ